MERENNFRQVKELTNFYKEVRDDNRISTRHIAVFMALFECWIRNDFGNPVHITRKEIMEAAKVSGYATYHRSMKELHEYGYIRYTPSFNSAIRSQVHLLT